MNRDQREFRQWKRKLKQLGSQHRRRAWKRDLREHPEDAPYSQERFGPYRTAPLNGHDHDATRRSRGGPNNTAPSEDPTP